MAQGNSPNYLPPPRIGMLYPIQIYILNRNIFQICTFPQKCARMAQGNPPNYIHPPKCLHDIFNTKLYNQLTYIPKLYIPTTMCQNGTGKPSKLPSSPKCLHDISNPNIYIPIKHTPKIFCSLYPIQRLFFKNLHYPTLCQNGTKKPFQITIIPQVLP